MGSSLEKSEPHGKPGIVKVNGKRIVHLAPYDAIAIEKSRIAANTTITIEEISEMIAYELQSNGVAEFARQFAADLEDVYDPFEPKLADMSVKIQYWIKSAIELDKQIPNRTKSLNFTGTSLVRQKCSDISVISQADIPIRHLIAKTQGIVDGMKGISTEGAKHLAAAVFAMQDGLKESTALVSSIIKKFGDTGIPMEAAFQAIPGLEEFYNSMHKRSDEIAAILKESMNFSPEILEILFDSDLTMLRQELQSLADDRDFDSEDKLRIQRQIEKLNERWAGLRRNSLTNTAETKPSIENLENLEDLEDDDPNTPLSSLKVDELIAGTIDNLNLGLEEFGIPPIVYNNTPIHPEHPFDLMLGVDSAEVNEAIGDLVDQASLSGINYIQGLNTQIWDLPDDQQMSVLGLAENSNSMLSDLTKLTQKDIPAPDMSGLLDDQKKNPFVIVDRIIQFMKSLEGDALDELEINLENIKRTEISTIGDIPEFIATRTAAIWALLYQYKLISEGLLPTISAILSVENMETYTDQLREQVENLKKHVLVSENFIFSQNEKGARAALKYVPATFSLLLKYIDYLKNLIKELEQEIKDQQNMDFDTMLAQATALATQ